MAEEAVPNSASGDVIPQPPQANVSAEDEAAAAEERRRLVALALQSRPPGPPTPEQDSADRAEPHPEFKETSAFSGPDAPQPSTGGGLPASMAALIANSGAVPPSAGGGLPAAMAALQAGAAAAPEASAAPETFEQYHSRMGALNPANQQSAPGQPYVGNAYPSYETRLSPANNAGVATIGAGSAGGVAAPVGSPPANALFRALSGQAGSLPTYEQANQQVLNASQGARQLSPQDYIRMITAASDSINQAGHLGIAQQNANTSMLGVQNAGRPDQTEANRAGLVTYNAALQRSHDEHPERTNVAHHQAAERETGMSTDRYMQLISADPMRPGLNQTTPGNTGPGIGHVNPASSAGEAADRDRARNRLSGGGEGVTDKPWAEIERQLHEASGYVAPFAGNRTTPANAGVSPKDVSTVGGFINRLETLHPRMLEANFPAVRDYAIAHFGEEAVNRAIRMSNDVRQLDRSSGSTPGAAILSFPQAVSQMFRQPTDEENGLSVLGHLNRAVRAAGGHDAFMRQQRARSGPTPNSPPIP